MCRFLRFSIFLATLTVAASASAQDKLTLHQTYRDVIRLKLDSGATQIPLPAGEWTLTGLYESRTDNNNILILSAYLVRVENGVVSGVVRFRVSAELLPYGWKSMSFCDRENMHIIEKKSNYESDVDCWGVHHSLLTKRKYPPKRQTIDYLVERNFRVPLTLMAVQFRRATEDKYFRVGYLFNPEFIGFPPPERVKWSVNDWHRDRIHTDPEKVAYVDRLKVWGREWKRNVDLGFAGKLDKTKISQPFVSPGIPLGIAPAAGGETTPTTKGDDTEARLRKLKGLYDQGLISDSEYSEKRKQILKGL